MFLTKTQEAEKARRDQAELAAGASSSGFVARRNMVSAHSLAARYRRAADDTDWKDDEKRERYLKRARELLTGDEAEVPDEVIQ